MIAVIALDQQIVDAVDGSRLDAGRRQPGSGRELHAERFVEDDALEALHGRLEDMRARCAAERDGNLAVFDAYGDLVLRAGERQPYSLVARQQRALGQFLENRREFLCRELAIAVIALRQRLARRE